MHSVLCYTSSASGHFSESAQVVLAKQLLPDSEARCAISFEKCGLANRRRDDEIGGGGAIEVWTRAFGRPPRWEQFLLYAGLARFFLAPQHRRALPCPVRAP